MDDATTERRAKVKKEASLTMRMTRETRQKLEASADTEGRSVSEMAERWLEASAALSGTPGLADTVRVMADFARELQRRGVGDPTQDSAAREALRHGWSIIATAALPFTPRSAEEKRLAEQRQAVVDAAGAVIEATKAQHQETPEDPLVTAMLEPRSVNIFASTDPYATLPLASLMALVVKAGDRPNHELSLELREGISAALEATYKRVEESGAELVPAALAAALEAFQAALIEYTRAEGAVWKMRAEARQKATELLLDLPRGG